MITSALTLVLIPFIIWTLVLAKNSKIRLLIVIASLLSTSVGSYVLCQVTWFKCIDIYYNPPSNVGKIGNRINITSLVESTQIESWSWVNIVFTAISFSCFDVAFLWFVQRYLIIAITLKEINS